MDTNAAIEHPLARAYPSREGTVLTYTTGAWPCPVALGFVDSVARRETTKGVYTTTMIVRLTVDARPLAAQRKKAPVPKRVFIKAALYLDLSDDGKVVDVRPSSLEWNDTLGGRYASVPSGHSWRRRDYEYQGLANDVVGVLKPWARDAILPLLPSLLEVYAEDKEAWAGKHDKNAADERAAIERGNFTDWLTPERRARYVEDATRSAEKCRAEAVLVRKVALLCAKAGGTGMAPADIAALADRAREAVARHAAATQEGARKAQEAAQAARRRAEERAAADAARERLEAAAPALLAALEALLGSVYRGGGDGKVLAQAEAAIAQAKGKA